MYASCSTCCTLASHSEYADGTDNRWTDGRHTVTLCFLIDAVSITMNI